MERPKGFFSTLCSFIIFLPIFIGLLILGIIKGVILCPVILIFMLIGNFGIILSLWPFHFYWTYYSILRSRQLGPFVKLLLCICLPAVLILWPVLGFAGSIVGGALYGLLSPIFATFDAIGEGKSDKFYHCFVDGTIDTVSGCFTIIRDFGDVCYHSYSSLMDDLQKKGPEDGKYYEIRLLQLPGALIAGVLGVLLDFPMVSFIALCKSPYMLFKGWHRLFHDLVGREGPFLETICVPFAGLAILLWPLAVAGAVLGSMVSSIFLGAYAAVIVYQQESFCYGLRYVAASLAIYDEYSNDILDLPEGSCFPRPQYRKKSEGTSRSASLTRPASSFKKSFSRTISFTGPLVDVKPFELLESWFQDCQVHGEKFLSEGLITQEDVEDAKSGKGSRVISTGLPTYCLLQALLRSAKANCAGILLSDNVTEITSTNRPRDAFFDWFLNPFLVIKDQLKAQNLSESEEDYLCKLVLLNGDPVKLKTSYIGPPPETERKRAELDALARRLQGIVKSISRFPTARRNFQNLVNNLSEHLARKSGNGNGRRKFARSKSAFARIFSQRSVVNGKPSFSHSSDSDSQQASASKEVEIV
ncbi:unnamed protein product [Linum tenue]|uniref:Uncharacterized protein n=1 Tax=Linum tenue TaxID=586396 RepID=A0AAV0NDP8_9ROSI|nr:unnamed protein product [Linum tenue]